jgi:hypothetical protein
MIRLHYGTSLDIHQVYSKALPEKPNSYALARQKDLTMQMQAVILTEYQASKPMQKKNTLNEECHHLENGNNCIVGEVYRLSPIEDIVYPLVSRCPIDEHEEAIHQSV